MLGWFFNPSFFFIGVMELFKKRTGLEEKFYSACKAVTDEHNYVIYDMDYIQGSSTVRLFIMNPETKTAIIEDCIKVDRGLSPFFEEEWVPDDVVLEVSSPGVYRTLKTKENFEAVVGEHISCTITGSLNEELVSDAAKSIKNEKNFRGVLKEFKEESILLDIDGFELPLMIEQIKKAHLDPEL
jgi:ribosome maturation factor RimP